MGDSSQDQGAKPVTPAEIPAEVKASSLGTWMPAVAVGVLGLGIVVGWRMWVGFSTPAVEREDPKKIAVVAASSLPKGETLVLDAAKPTATKASWPGFRGEKSDGIAHGAVKLARSWVKEQPKLRWMRPLGVWPEASAPAGLQEKVVHLEVGHSGMAVHGGFAYVSDYALEQNRDMVRAINLDTGKDAWVFAYPYEMKAPHGISRCTVAVNDKYVITIGPKAHLWVLDRLSGQTVKIDGNDWAKDFVAEYKTKIPEWLSAQSPIIDGDRLIIAPSGVPLMVCLDLTTGKEIWRTPNYANWKMTHTTIVPMTIAGKKMYVYSGQKGVVGIDPENGKIIWDTLDWKVNTATVASPVHCGGTDIFLCGGYKAGSQMLRLIPQSATFSVQRQYKLSDEVPLDGRAFFGSEQHTPIFFEGKIYGVRTNGEMVCIDPATGKEVWASGREHLFGLGPFIITPQGLMLTAADKGGRLELAETGGSKYNVLGTTTIVVDELVYAPMTLVDNVLLVRDKSRLACYELPVEKP